MRVPRAARQTPPVAHALARAQRLDRRQVRRERHHGAQVVVGGIALEGRAAVERDAAADHVEGRPRLAQGRRRVGGVDDGLGEARAQVARPRPGSARAARCRNAALSPAGSSAAAKWVISPATVTPSPAEAAASARAATSSGRAPSRPMPVSSLRCTRGRRPAAAKAARAHSTASGVHTATSAAGGGRPRPLLVAQRAHHEQGAVQTRPPQLLGLADRGDGQIVRAALEGRAGHGGGAVPVPLGLDHRHQPRPARRGRQRGGVVAHGPEVDPGDRPGRAQPAALAQRARQRLEHVGRDRPVPPLHELAGARVRGDGGGGGDPGRQALRQERGDGPGEHVARPGGREGRRAARVDHGRRPRRRGDRPRPLQHDGRAGALRQLLRRRRGGRPPPPSARAPADGPPLRCGG